MPAADYCDFSGMRTADCAHCSRGLKVLPRATSEEQDEDDGPTWPAGSVSAVPGHPFRAKFASGRCAGCRNTIAIGDLIKADGEGGWIHEDCDE